MSSFDIAFAIFGVVVLLFGFVVFFGAPYVPTLRPQVKAALKLADMSPGQHLLELGSGDGVVLLAAARQGVRVTGYEINPILVIISRIRTWRYRKLVTVVWGNFWRGTLPEADGIFVFLLPKYMRRLDNKITQEYSGKKVKLVSFAFEIPDREPTQVQNGVYLYTFVA